MGGALIQAGVSAGTVSARDISVYDVDRAKALAIKSKCPVRAANSVREAVDKAQYIFLCVKPQQMKELMAEISRCVTPKQCLISIAAGVSTASLEKMLSGAVPVIRTMPNTPALVQCGMTAVTKGRYAREHHLRFAMKFFSSVGEAVSLPEKAFHAVTAVSVRTSVPFIWPNPAKVRGRFSWTETAELLAVQTLVGAGKMLSAKTPQELRKWTSSGVTTEAAVKHLSAKNWSWIVEEAVRNALNRSSELIALLGS